jgi:hypothetical protein
MKILMQLLIVSISYHASCAEGKLAGLLQEFPEGTFRVSNEEYPNENHSRIPLTISGKADLLKGKVGKYVEMNGSYEISDGTIKFKAESIKVLAEEYYLEGQIVPYKHPDGSMAGIKFAIVTSSGSHYALSSRDFKEDVPLKHVRAYGQFKGAGHKNYLLAFYPTKIETVSIKE